jgi:hypothetical protein
MLYAMIENNSFYGKTIYGIEKLGSNVALVNHNYLQSAEISTDSVGNPQVVRLNIHLTFDEKNYTVDRYYTPEKVFSKVLDSDGKEVRTTNGVYVISKDIQIQKEYIHNLGICPIVLSYNYPFKTEFYQVPNVVIQFSGKSDNSYSHSLFKYFFQSDTTYAQDIEDLINSTYQTYLDESIKSETTLVLGGGSGNEFLSGDNSNMDERHRNAYLNSGYIVNINGRNIDISKTNNPNKLNEILASCEILEEKYFNRCGLSFPSITGGNNKHGDEIATTMQLSIQTHKVKRHNIEKIVKEMIYKCALVYGLSEEDAKDFFFQLKELSTSGELELAQALVLAKQNALIDGKTAMCKYLDVSSDKAETLLEAAKKEQEALMYAQAQNNALSSSNEATGGSNE